jgi:hypothetical protein
MTRTAQLGEDILPVPLDDQHVALIQFAGPTQLTKAKTHAFRLVGFFDVDDHADEHIEDMPKVATCKAPCAQSVTFGIKVAMEDGPGQLAFINHVLEATRVDILKEEQKFDDYVNRRQTGTTADLAVMDAQEKKETDEQRAKYEATKTALGDRIELAKEEYKSKGKRKKVRRLKEAHVVDGQRFAVVSIMHDPSDTGDIKDQWVVVCWGGFPTKKAAKAYLSDTIQHKARFFTSMVVKMYEWLYCDLINTRDFQLTVRGVYRHQDQQDMWSGAFDNKKEVAAVMDAHKEAETIRKLEADIAAGVGADTRITGDRAIADETATTAVTEGTE